MIDGYLVLSIPNRGQTGRNRVTYLHPFEYSGPVLDAATSRIDLQRIARFDFGTGPANLGIEFCYHHVVGHYLWGMSIVEVSDTLIMKEK